MKSHKIALIAALCVAFVAIQGFAQADESDEMGTDNQVLGIEAGLIAGYRLFDGQLVAGQSFSLNLSVARNVQVGFSSGTLTGGAPLTDAYALLKIGYFMTPWLGFNISVGSAVLDVGGAATITPAIGAGVFFNAFSNKSLESFSTALKIKLDYLADTTNGLDNGTITFGLAGVFGL